MDVNSMPGLVEDVSDAEDVDVKGAVNALQNGDTCYFCKKSGHQKRDCRKFDEWKRKNPNRKYGSDTHKANSRPSILCYNCGKEGHIALECRGEQRNQGRRENGGFGGGQIADIAKSMAAMQEVLQKLVQEAVFPYGVPMTDGRQLLRLQKIMI
ncbi:branchpoint-bridging protein [Eurytemora carolleeae]|uniref:branchpoint-bridging protein n=1 Tax=Eurytemora carolleeae TaxID=1294199 RepID=UPI000C7631AA|nr:branchpoint-bridging protein [Eurytemora carolleeae]|eukprot:XP_023345211.1 branchpoint-bridging protein-like [Eurytemora affinis]